MEGPFRAQPLVGNIIHNTKFNRVSLVVVGEDKNGEMVVEKPIVISLKDDKISIEANNTDLDLRRELTERGVPPEDILSVRSVRVI
jgi:hypothetical protein